MESVRKLFSHYFQTKHELFRYFLAEFAGTAFLIAVGDGCVAQSVLSEGTKGGYLTITFAWGFAVTFAVYLCGGVSGAHINPAISMVNFLLGNLSFRALIVYSIAQYLGAFVGAATVYFSYFEALDAFDGGIRLIDGVKGTAGIFATFPAQHLTTTGGFVDQLVGTSILTICVIAISDPHNKIPKSLGPILVGFVVTMIGMTYGFNCGYAINPARDLSQRVFLMVAGWGTQVFSYRSFNWFWVPIVGPYLGALIGTSIYYLTIGLHWPSV